LTTEEFFIETIYLIFAKPAISDIAAASLTSLLTIQKGASRPRDVRAC
jgi:hypothetical protein